MFSITEYQKHFYFLTSCILIYVQGVRSKLKSNNVTKNYLFKTTYELLTFYQGNI